MKLCPLPLQSPPRDLPAPAPLYPELDRLSGRQHTQFNLRVALLATPLFMLAAGVICVGILMALSVVAALFAIFVPAPIVGVAVVILSGFGALVALTFLLRSIMEEADVESLWPWHKPHKAQQIRDDLHLQTIGHLLALSQEPPDAVLASWEARHTTLHLCFTPRPSVRGHVVLDESGQGIRLTVLFEDAQHRRAALEQLLTSPRFKRLTTALELDPKLLKITEVQEETVQGLAIADLDLRVDADKALAAAERCSPPSPRSVADPADDPAVTIAALVQLLFVAAGANSPNGPSNHGLERTSLAALQSQPQQYAPTESHAPITWPLNSGVQPHNVPMPSNALDSSWPGRLAMGIFVVGAASVLFLVAFFLITDPPVHDTARTMIELAMAATTLSLSLVMGVLLGFCAGRPRFASKHRILTRQLTSAVQQSLNLKEHVLSDGRVQIALTEPFEVHWTGWRRAQEEHGAVTLTLSQRTSRLRVQVVGVEVDEAFERLERLDVRAPQCAPDVFAKELWPLIATYEAIT